jgi:endoglucanase
MIELIRRLASATAVSGREKEICEIIKGEFPALFETFYLPSGDLIVKLPGSRKNAKKIMISTNIDVRGFFVTFIENGGKIRLALSDSELNFSKYIGDTLVSNNKIEAKLLSEKDASPRLSEIYAEVENSNIDSFKPGDVFSLKSEITEENGRISGLNLASRAIIYAMIVSAKEMSPTHDVYFVFNSCGIPGGRGAKSSTYAIRPDIALSLRTLESKESRPVLLARDGMSLSSIDFFDKAISCAADSSVDIALSATTTGTRDAWSISTTQTGVPTISLALPCLDLGEKSESVLKDTVSEFSKIITAIAENILN